MRRETYSKLKFFVFYVLFVIFNYTAIGNMAGLASTVVATITVLVIFSTDNFSNKNYSPGEIWFLVLGILPILNLLWFIIIILILIIYFGSLLLNLFEEKFVKD
jgi:hypothetical protein